MNPEAKFMLGCALVGGGMLAFCLIVLAPYLRALCGFGRVEDAVRRARESEPGTWGTE